MKARMLLIISIILLATAIVAGGCATTKKVSKKDYRFYSGTWINEEYNTHPHLARWVIRPDGTYDGYFRTTDTEKATIGNYKIVDKWTDSEGNVWYKEHVWHGEIFEGKPAGYSLDRFSDSGNVWEYVSITGDFPVEINENHPRYHIYYRK
jgi:hypothetical protein